MRSLGSLGDFRDQTAFSECCVRRFQGQGSPGGKNVGHFCGVNFPVNFASFFFCFPLACLTEARSFGHGLKFLFFLHKINVKVVR